MYCEESRENGLCNRKLWLFLYNKMKWVVLRHPLQVRYPAVLL